MQEEKPILKSVLMSASNKTILSFLIGLLISGAICAQDCTTKLQIKVLELNSGAPISSANIALAELGDVWSTDSKGTVEIPNICPRKYHLSVSHVGCEQKQYYVHIDRDTSIVIKLDHNSQYLHEAHVQAQSRHSTEENKALKSAQISQNAEKSLANMLDNITGVSTIKNGGAIAKPVVHGMYGNRLTIINNGIPQSGQQWGVDHSPEIDPLVANRITVIKGVASLEYAGSNLGAVVLVEPAAIGTEPHLHGESKIYYESNGRGLGLNTALQKSGKHLSFRAVATYKKDGDRHSPHYYLRNTGSREANIALQLEKKWSDKLFTDLYFSSYNTDLGILRGSQIGNLTDLNDALRRDTPFFTQDAFSSSIDAPYQSVGHQLLKFHAKYSFSTKDWLDFSYALQFDKRREYDVRRSGRSEIPALSLEQYSYFTELKYRRFMAHDLDLKSGVQLNFVQNTNVPETGILPLIPDYYSSKYGIYALLHKHYDKLSWETGLRYNVETRNVAAISRTVPRRILRYYRTYHNFIALAGLRYRLDSDWDLSYNLGWAGRNPEVNELYSSGLHQGVSGIEEGDENLKTEKSLKQTISLRGQWSDKLFVDVIAYYQFIEDYIYLQPTQEIRLTIRGAFPVFHYTQTQASIAGLDFSSTYQFSDGLSLMLKYSLIDGRDRAENRPLIFMPSNVFFGEFKYQKPILDKQINLDFHVNLRHVFKQDEKLADQDFVAPPAPYSLIGLHISVEKQLRNNRIVPYLKVQNLFNTAYRDYLNRQRYFADDLGRNIVLGLNVFY